MACKPESHVVDWRRAGARGFESVTLLRDRNAARALPFDDYLTISTIEPAKAIGLQIRYYPGLWFLLLSATLVVAGVAWMMRFWKPPTAARPEFRHFTLTTPSPLAGEGGDGGRTLWRTPPPTFVPP